MKNTTSYSRKATFSVNLRSGSFVFSLEQIYCVLIRYFTVVSTELMLDTIRLIDHIVAADALVYCVGSLKFLTGNSTLLKSLHKKGCFETLSKLLIRINKTVSGF